MNTEWLVSNALGLKLATNSRAGYDGITNKRKTISMTLTKVSYEIAKQIYNVCHADKVSNLPAILNNPLAD